MPKKDKYGYTKMKRGSPAARSDRRKIKKEIKSWRRPNKKDKPKEKHLINLKREKEMSGKGWKVARTEKYTDQPKKAIGKKGYPYAVLNKNNHYESFYTWKEKPPKKKVVKTKTPKQKEKLRNPKKRKKATYKTSKGKSRVIKPLIPEGYKVSKKTGSVVRTTRSIKKEVKSWRNPNYKKK